MFENNKNVYFRVVLEDGRYAVRASVKAEGKKEVSGQVTSGRFELTRMMPLFPWQVFGPFDQKNAPQADPEVIKNMTRFAKFQIKEGIYER